MLAADGCASSSSNLACCFYGVWAPAGRGSGGRHVRALTRLGMLICRIEGVVHAHIYPRTGIISHVLDPVGDRRAAFSIVLVGNKTCRIFVGCGNGAMPQAPRQIVQFWRLCRQGASAK